MNEKTSVQDVAQSLQEGSTLSNALGMEDSQLDAIASIAVAYYREAQFSAASKLLEGLTALRPERSEYWSALGAVLTCLEQYESALQVLSVAIQLDPADTAALVNRAQVHMALADTESAAKDLSTAIQLDPGEKDPASNRARLMIVAFSQFFEECSEAGLDSVEVEDE